MAMLEVVPIELARAVAHFDYEEAFRLLIEAGEREAMPSRYWRYVKQAADVLEFKEVAHLARAKRRETGLTDI